MFSSYKYTWAIFFFTSFSAIAQLHPGDTAGNAATIDADAFDHFSNGVAVVRKGNATVLIDTCGRQVIPFNEFNCTFSMAYKGNHAGFLRSPGFFECIQNNKLSWLNSSGVRIADALFQPVEQWNMLIYSNSGVYYYISHDGTGFTLQKALTAIADQMGIYKGAGGKLGYWSLKDTLVTESVFDEAEPFSEGLALVGIKDADNTMRYGFIDRSGKYIIDLRYSIKPSSFHDGLAMVERVDKRELAYGFIDSKGTLMIGQTKKDITLYGTFNRFVSGYAFSGTHVMNHHGDVITNNEFFKEFNIQDGKFLAANGGTLREDDYGDLIQYTTETRSALDSTLPLVGFINLGTKEVIPPIFELDPFNLYFDPVAQLAYAKFAVQEKESKKPVYREGYINRKGIFMIVRAAGNDNVW